MFSPRDHDVALEVPVQLVGLWRIPRIDDGPDIKPISSFLNINCLGTDSLLAKCRPFGFWRFMPRSCVIRSHFPDASPVSWLACLCLTCWQLSKPGFLFDLSTLMCGLSWIYRMLQVSFISLVQLRRTVPAKLC